MRGLFTITLLVIASTFCCTARAEDWPMFGRDQTRNAVSPEKSPPTWWQVKTDKTRPSKNIRWSVRLAAGSYVGRIYGDPVVVDGLIWVGTSNEELWFTTNRCEVVCLDIGPLKKREGEPRVFWKLDMRKDLGVSPRASLWDYRLCSIAGYMDLLYVITGNGVHAGSVNPDAPSLVCLSKKTGTVVWKDNSPGKGLIFSQYASPTIIDVNGQAQVVAPQGDGWLRSFDPATGKPLWKFDTNPPEAQGRTRNYLPATAVFHNNRIYIGNGQEPEHFSGPAWLYSIDPSKSGDISPHLLSNKNGKRQATPNPNSGLVWKFGGEDESQEAIFNLTLPNVTICDGLVIAPTSAGDVHCLDAQTGQEYWCHDAKSQIFGSALIVDGKVIVGTHDGDVWVLRLSKDKKVLRKIDMDASVHCTPVFANGVLYVATNTLYAIAGNEKEP